MNLEQENEQYRNNLRLERNFMYGFVIGLVIVLVVAAVVTFICWI